jgi:deoxyhypusine synthase
MHRDVSVLSTNLNLSWFTYHAQYLRIILGGGVIKHHTCNANLMRNGAEYAVFINTGQVTSLSAFPLSSLDNLFIHEFVGI